MITLLYPSKFVTVLSVLFFFLSFGVSAQQISRDTSQVLVKWEEFELTGPHSKLVASPWFKWWYVPVVVIPPTVYFSVNKDGEEEVPPPTINCFSDQTLLWGQDLPAPNPAAVVATTNCPDGGLAIEHVSDVSNNGTGCFGNPLDIIRTYQATDACGNTASCTQNITYVIDEESPSLSCPPDLALQWGDSLPIADVSTLTTNDNCTPIGDIVLIHQSDEDNGGSSCSGDPRVVLRTYQATDACGNTASCTQNITYAIDKESPTIFCPPNVVLECTDDIAPSSIGEATATDNGTPSSEISIGYQDDLSGLTTCNQTGTIIRTWAAVDNCGNLATCVQEITLTDNTAPIFINTPTDLTVDCNSIPLPFNVTVSDNCSDTSNPTIDLVEVIGTGCPFEITRTWTATDACGNVNTYTQIITVEDNEAPIVSCPADAIVICGESTNPAVTGIPLITDFCTDVSFSFTDDFSNQTDCSGFIIRTFEAVDECGNLVSCEQLLHIVNTGCDLMPDITVENAACAIPDGEIAIAPIAGYTYNWSNGAVGPVITDLTSGTYTVTIVNDDLSCSQILPVTVPEAPPYDLILDHINQPSSPGASDGNIELSVVDPNAFPPFIILLNGSVYGSTGTSSFIIENLAADSYIIQVLDINGCPSTEVTVILTNNFGLNSAPPGANGMLKLTPIQKLPADGYKQHSKINHTDKLSDELLTYLEHPLLEEDLEMHYVSKGIQGIAGGLFLRPGLLIHGSLEWYEGDASNILDKGQTTPVYLRSHFRGLQVIGGLRQYVDAGNSRFFMGTQARWRNLAGEYSALTLNDPIIRLSQFFSDDYFDCSISSGWQFQLSKDLSIEIEWQEELELNFEFKDADLFSSKRYYLLNLQYQY